MPEDENTRLGTQTARQGGALVADGMAVTLFIGGDAGISGYGAGAGQDDLQQMGKRSGRYERSEGAGRSRRIGIPKEGVDGKTPIRPNGGAQVMHASLWKENALPPHRDRYKTCEVKTDLGGSS